MSELPQVLSFAGAFLSLSVSELCTYPLDLLKTRMQVGSPQFTSLQQVIHHVYKPSGARGFFKGIEASLMKHFCYAGIRISIYYKLKELMQEDTGFSGFLYLEAGVAGGLATVLSTPLELAKIRLINDPLRAKYSGVFDVMRKTYRNEGLFHGFYKGTSANFYNAVLVNALQLGTYDNSTVALMEFCGLEGPPLRGFASIIAGLVAASLCSPLDVVKTRYMNAVKPDPRKHRGNELRYVSPLDCFKKIVRFDGVRSLYSGFWFLWARLSLSCMVVLAVMDEFNGYAGKRYRKYSAQRALRNDS